MDSFEHVIAAILQRRGYWTQTSLKVGLTTEEKKAVGRPSSPRWEIDVVGYRGASNQLIALECKSFLDSSGVSVRTFEGKNTKDESKYKLFFDDTLRTVVLGRLVHQLVDEGFCAKSPSVSFGLAAGKVAGDAGVLRTYFDKHKWDLWTPDIIRAEIRKLRDIKYENNVATIVAKILLRDEVEAADE
jgi:hypothetical protein